MQWQVLQKHWLFCGITKERWPPSLKIEKGLEMSSEMSQHKIFAAVMLVSECAKIWREINMADEEELYLANLDEFVNDEEKIVSESTWI